MQYLVTFLVAFLWVSLVGAYFCVYIDEWHDTSLPDVTMTEGVNCAIIAFANSSLFVDEQLMAYKPFKPVQEIRAMFVPDTKLLIAIGGWGDTKGLSAGSKDQTTRELYAKNVAKMLDTHGFDGVDIDWEYPGGNGEDYLRNSNEEKKFEIETYPQLLAAIRAAMGKDKLLSIAVPGREADMIAYTREQAPKIWESVDFVNVMSYDLVNRRANWTEHHTSVEGSLEAINRYLCLGLAPKKIHLGFAFYAKWFTTDANFNCDDNHLGCPLVAPESEDGSDTDKSGTITFERHFMAKPPTQEFNVTSNGSCGLVAKLRCTEGYCCSADRYCGETDAFCGMNCMAGYGKCDVEVTAQESWLRALTDGKSDTKAGGNYYFDSSANIFWTWDTPDHMARKYEEIVKAKGLGGIMAWSLGEDSYDWSHLKAMQEMALGQRNASKSCEQSASECYSRIGWLGTYTTI